MKKLVLRWLLKIFIFGLALVILKNIYVESAIEIIKEDIACYIDSLKKSYVKQGCHR